VTYGTICAIGKDGMTFEHTIERPAEVAGTGLHTGVSCRLRLLPAPAGTGVVFRRVDLEGFEVEARAANGMPITVATREIEVPV